MTNNAMVLCLTEFLKTKQVTEKAKVFIKSKKDHMMQVNFIFADKDGDTVLKGMASNNLLEISGDGMGIGSIYPSIPVNNRMIFAHGISDYGIWDSYLIDDVYVEDGNIIIGHV